MIQITPYYRNEARGKAMLTQFLRMVADVAPFPPEDVLFDDPDGLAHCRKKSAKRAEDAEALISDYSGQLHAYLYDGGQVNRDHLRDLLTVQMPEGQLPGALVLSDADRDQSSELLKKVFRYEALSSHRDLYRFVEALGVEVCPYCNRQYTTTISTEDRKTRPQLDHFKNKKDYPYLALSINNLVPSCAVCNLLKRDKDAPMVYPYEEGFGDDCAFTMKLRDGELSAVMTGARIAPEHFDLQLRPTGARGDRIKGSVEELALEALYNQSHKGYVSALAFHHYIVTEALIDDLYSQFGGELFKSKEEIRMALTLMNTEPEHWGERPLAKLTHDIQRYLER